MQGRKTVLSGVQPSGELHIGNYYGAMLQFPALASDPENLAMVFVANLHAQTTREGLDTLERCTIEIVQWYLALGLDPQRDIVYAQSSVPETTTLNWLLSCFTRVQDMTETDQFRDKASAQAAKGEITSFGLAGYPVLMAADILGPGADIVPVGEDQRQHLEIARNLAVRVNRYFEEDIFPIPEMQVSSSARVMSLSDPKKKMSKSEPDGAVFLTDAPRVIREKLTRRWTHTGDRAALCDQGSPDKCNVFDMHVQFTEVARLSQIRGDCVSGSSKFGCSACKGIVAERVIADIAPLQERHREVVALGEDYVRDVLREGGKRARAMVAPRVERLMHFMGTPFF